VPARWQQLPPVPHHIGHRGRGDRALEEVLRVLKKLVLAAVAAGTLAALRKRSSGKAENDLWHEATRGPGAVSTPTAP
jgi:hypothetical protein